MYHTFLNIINKGEDFINNLKVLSLFSGIGAFEKALSKQKIDYELINYCEIDKFASKSYSAIHSIPESLNLGDITKIDEKLLPDFDLLVGASPCTNVSIAGNKKGLAGDQSKLFYDYSKILNYKKPKYFIFENVDNLINSNNGNDFIIVKEELSKNYNIYYKVLDAKNYTIPQSRKRLFIIGIRKDIKQEFNFPESKELKIQFKDLLQKQVDSKYYLSKKERQYMDREVKGGRTHWDFQHHHDTNNTYSHCIVANIFKGVPYNVLKDNDIIRKLTPLECFRLMGFDDEDYYKAKEARISDTQLYKQAGNSIVVNVLEYIIQEFLKEYINIKGKI